MKFLFIIQGEGRGHITQAISLLSILKEHGHDVPVVLLGKSPFRQPPPFAYEKIGVQIVEYDSPGFIFARNKKGIRLGRSFIYNLARMPRYIKSILRIRSLVKQHDPDAIINFYDLIGGLYNFFFPGKRFICIGHQFLMSHPGFPLPKGRALEKKLLFMHNRIVSCRADKCLALSFRPMNCEDGNILIAPPLLRKEVIRIDTKLIRDEEYLHGYLLNEGFAQEIIDWHNQNPDFLSRIFCQSKSWSGIKSKNKNIAFCPIDDMLFLNSLINCSMFATTAGFESLCEAMYLGKPFLCVPTENHYEQACNALDATIDGAGIWDTHFNLDRLIAFSKNYNFDVMRFRKWANSAPGFFLHQLCGDYMTRSDGSQTNLATYDSQTALKTYSPVGR